MRKRAVLVILIALAPLSSLAEERPGWLGLGFTYHRNATEQWLVVQIIAPKGPADRAGLQLRDVITAIDGRELSFRNDHELLTFLAGVRPRKPVRFHLIRNQRQMTIDVTPVEMTDSAWDRWKRNLEIARRKAVLAPK